MFEIRLKNGKTFKCSENKTIFEGAKEENVIFDYSCLSARCRSCIGKVLEGKVISIHDEKVLSDKEKNDGYVLTCNSLPVTDLRLDIQDLGGCKLPAIKTIPVKIDRIEKVKEDIVKILLRIPPNSNFDFIAGQYVNVIKGNIKRSYSIANNVRKDSKIELFIKKYEGGVMSEYWFKDAKCGDLLRLEGPLGTFFYREDGGVKNIVFLATGTGIAPVKAIYEQIELDNVHFLNKNIIVLWGARFKDDFFWKPNNIPSNVEFIEVLSKEDSKWEGEKGYIQDVLLRKGIAMDHSQVYACGSYDMIDSSMKKLKKNGLSEINFYSDAFVSSN